MRKDNKKDSEKGHGTGERSILLEITVEADSPSIFDTVFSTIKSNLRSSFRREQLTVTKNYPNKKIFVEGPSSTSSQRLRSYEASVLNIEHADAIEGVQWSFYDELVKRANLSSSSVQNKTDDESNGKQPETYAWEQLTAQLHEAEAQKSLLERKVDALTGTVGEQKKYIGQLEFRDAQFRTANTKLQQDNETLKKQTGTLEEKLREQQTTAITQMTVAIQAKDFHNYALAYLSSVAVKILELEETIGNRELYSNVDFDEKLSTEVAKLPLLREFANREAESNARKFIRKVLAGDKSAYLTKQYDKSHANDLTEIRSKDKLIQIERNIKAIDTAAKISSMPAEIADVLKEPYNAEKQEIQSRITEYEASRQSFVDDALRVMDSCNEILEEEQCINSLWSEIRNELGVESIPVYMKTLVENKRYVLELYLPFSDVQPNSKLGKRMLENLLHSPSSSISEKSVILEEPEIEPKYNVLKCRITLKSKSASSSDLYDTAARIEDGIRAAINDFEFSNYGIRFDFLRKDEITKDIMESYEK